MADLAFNRAVADANASVHTVGGNNRRKDRERETTLAERGSASRALTTPPPARATARLETQLQLDDEDMESKDRISLSGEISAVQMHHLAITLRPLPGGSSGGRAMLTASRWEIRKAIMSLCSTAPSTFEVEATDKSASIRISFEAGAAAEVLSSQLRGVTIKIKGVKLHAFVRQVSESSSLSEGEDWATVLFGAKVLESGRETAFNRLSPGRRPDTVILRGIPSNWLGDKGRAAEGASAPGLEFIMRKFGTVRSVEVAPSVLSGDDATTDSPAAVAGTRTKPVGFDVHALLENMPQPRALAKGKGGGGRGSGGGGVGGVGLSGVVSVGLNVDAWVQFASFGSFKRALKGLQGRVLQKAGADLMCEYRLGVDVAGHMTEEKRRERDLIRRQDTKEKKRRKLSIEDGRDQLVSLREGVRGLQTAVAADGRPALEATVKGAIEKVMGHVGKTETLLGVHDTMVDEKKATAAVSHARGELAIARLSIRKAKQAVGKAEDEERERIKRKEDNEARDAARAVLEELEDTLSRGLALVTEEREHPGIKPQADRAAGLLQTLSEACSKDGGSEVLEGGALVVEARQATETATTRACMLQRYLSMSTRFVALRVEVDAAVLAVNSKANGNIDDNGKKEGSHEGGGTKNGALDNGSSDAPVVSVNKCNLIKADDTAGNSILAVQLLVAAGILSRELQELSEGDLLLISESAEETLNTADGMLDTLKLVNTARGRLADTKAALVTGESQLKSSEGVMRLMAAAVMSMARAQRDSTVSEAIETAAAAAVMSGSRSLSRAADRWRTAAQAADFDVKAAEQEVERATKELHYRQEQEEKEEAWRKSEEERRLREEEEQKAEQEARTLESEIEERRRMEARIFAMELRKKEMTAQVRNKAARERLQEWFRRHQARRKRRGRDDELQAIADRWTLDEGLEAKLNTSTISTTPPLSDFNTKARATPAIMPGAIQAEGEATGFEKAASVLLRGRWEMGDGAEDLAERGIEIKGAGLHLPLPFSPFSTALKAGGAKGRKRNREAWTEKEEKEWFELVSRSVRSTIVGRPSLGSWGLELGNEEDGAKSDVDVAGGENEAKEGESGRSLPPPGACVDGPSSKGIVVPSGKEKEGPGGDATSDSPARATRSEALLSSRGGGEKNYPVGNIAASSAVKGGSVEAELRQQLLEKMGKLHKRGNVSSRT